MKRLIGILVLLFVAVSFISAQVTARTAVQHTMRKSATYYKYTGVAADTCGTEQDTLYFEILSNKSVPVTCNARVEVTRTGETETYDIDLEGKVFKNDSWSKIVENATQEASKSMYEPETSMVDTLEATHVGVANAMPGSGDNFYRYFRVFVGNDGTCGNADKLTVNYVIFKLYER